MTQPLSYAHVRSCAEYQRAPPDALIIVLPALLRRFVAGMPALWQRFLLKSIWKGNLFRYKDPSWSCRQSTFHPLITGSQRTSAARCRCSWGNRRGSAAVFVRPWSRNGPHRVHAQREQSGVYRTTAFTSGVLSLVCHQEDLSQQIRLPRQVWGDSYALAELARHLDIVFLLWSEPLVPLRK